MRARVAATAVTLALALAAATAGCTEFEVQVPHPCLGLPAPAEGQGLQLSSPEVEVAPGQEETRCAVRIAPADIDVQRIVRLLPAQRELAELRRLDVYYLEGQRLEEGDYDDCSDVPRDRSRPPPQLLVSFQGDVADWTAPEPFVYRIRQGATLMLDSRFRNETGRPARVSECVNLHASRAADRERVSSLFDEERDFIGAEPAKRYERICEFPEEVEIVALAGFMNVPGFVGEVFRVDAYLWDPATRMDGELIYSNAEAGTPRWETNLEWGAPVRARGLHIVAELENTSRWGNLLDGRERLGTHVLFAPARNLDPGCYCRRKGELPVRFTSPRPESVPCPNDPPELP